MDNPEIVILNILLIIALIFLIYRDSMLIRKLKTKPKNDFKQIELYIELKYRIQFLISIFSIIIVVVTFFGKSTYDGIFQKVDSEIKSTINKHNTAFSKLQFSSDSLNKEFGLLSDSIRNIKINVANITEELNEKDRTLKKMNDSINSVLSKDIITANIYIVDGLKYNTFINNKFLPDSTYYFKDLVTVNNQRLPIFKKKPIIMITSTNNVTPSILSVTKDYFKISDGTLNDYSNMGNVIIEFNVWIFQN